MANKRKSELTNKVTVAPQNPFSALLPPWDSRVPNLELPDERAKVTSLYYGYEDVPHRDGWIRDVVEQGAEGVTEQLPKPLHVPKTYWVPLVMLDWSITVNQHLRRRMLELADSTKNKKRKATCAEWGLLCLQRLWWYVRCREHIEADVKSHGQSAVPPEFVGSLNELLWREWNNWIEEEVPARMMLAGVSVHKSAFRALFVTNGGFIGQ